MEKEIVVMCFSPDKLRAALVMTKTKQTELANFLGKTKQTISTYAQGNSTPDANTFLRILAFFGNDLSVLTEVHSENAVIPNTLVSLHEIREDDGEEAETEE